MYLLETQPRTSDRPCSSAAFEEVSRGFLYRAGCPSWTLALGGELVSEKDWEAE